MDDNQNDSVDTSSSGAAGQPQGEMQQSSPVVQAQTSEQTSQSTVNETAASDAGDHKLYAILGYILPFLFFLPLLQDSSKNDPFARFHANQQLILLLGWVAVYVVGNVLIMALYMFVFLLPLLNLAFLVLAIIGVINAAQGQMKELPLIGKFTLLK